MAASEVRATPERKRWDAELYQAAQEMYNETPRPSFAEMEERLEAKFGAAPTARALQEWPKKGWLTEEAEDEPWKLGDLDPDDDALVLAFIQDDMPGRLEEASAIDYQTALDDVAVDGLRSDLVPTLRVARWVVKVRKAAPDLEDTRAVIRLARQLMLGGRSAEEAKMVLAFAPWRDEGAALRQALFFRLIDKEVLYVWDPQAQLDAYLEMYEKGELHDYTEEWESTHPEGRTKDGER